MESKGFGAYWRENSPAGCFGVELQCLGRGINNLQGNAVVIHNQGAQVVEVDRLALLRTVNSMVIFPPFMVKTVFQIKIDMLQLTGFDFREVQNFVDGKSPAGFELVRRAAKA